MKVDFPASKPAAFINEPQIKGVIHPGNLPLDVPPRADGATSVAGVGGFDPNYVGKGMLGKIVHAAADPAHRFRQHRIK
jgi:hypothetical protein